MWARLREPTPIYTLVWLRIALGLLGGGDILGNGIYYHWYLDEFSGFTFRYFGFEWVTPLPEPLLSIYFILGFLLGIAVALGWRFRITAPLFALFFSYLFLLEKAHYLNHAYLFCWLAWLLAASPAWREWSLDVRRRPELRRTHVPALEVFLFPALMGLVYFYGGIAKLNYDWLIEAVPLRYWLERRAEMPMLGPVFAEEITAYVMAWGGMLLDLTAAFLLLHRRLRWVALGFLLLFHATNHLIFNIGIFPYLSMVLTSMFFEPDWPKRFVNWVRKKTPALPQFYGTDAADAPKSVLAPDGLRFKTLWLVPLFAIHLLLPFRHWTFDSDVNWSEEGHRYSWRMMLRSKQGNGHFIVKNRETGKEVAVWPARELHPKQYRKMATHPDMILQYAHHLAERHPEHAIYGRFRVRLNGRAYREFIDPEVDLSQVEWSWFSKKDWVLAEPQD